MRIKKSHKVYAGQFIVDQFIPDMHNFSKIFLVLVLFKCLLFYFIDWIHSYFCLDFNLVTKRLRCGRSEEEKYLIQLVCMTSINVVSWFVAVDKVKSNCPWELINALQNEFQKGKYSEVPFSHTKEFQHSITASPTD